MVLPPASDRLYRRAARRRTLVVTEAGDTRPSDQEARDGHHPHPRPDADQRPAAGRRLDAPARKLGLPSATALVVGSIIGTGVFTMPAVMAGAGTSSLITLGVVALGALVLAVGLPVYAFLKAHRERHGLVEEPVDLPQQGRPALVEGR